MYMDVLVTVGEFSRMSHLSVKALRHYHEIGLLEPADVDPVNGYRRYTTGQVPDRPADPPLPRPRDAARRGASGARGPGPRGPRPNHPRASRPDGTPARGDAGDRRIAAHAPRRESAPDVGGVPDGDGGADTGDQRGGRLRRRRGLARRGLPGARARTRCDGQRARGCRRRALLRGVLRSRRGRGGRVRAGCRDLARHTDPARRAGACLPGTGRPSSR